jgi:hypothetical protein
MVERRFDALDMGSHSRRIGTRHDSANRTNPSRQTETAAGESLKHGEKASQTGFQQDGQTCQTERSERRLLATRSENVKLSKSISPIICPGCGKTVDEAFYPQHIDSNHVEHTIVIKGLDPMVITQPTAIKQARILDIPYLGRVSANGFVAWTLLCILFGVLMGARII